MSDSQVFEKIFSDQLTRENYKVAQSYLTYFISYIGIEDNDLYNLEIFKAKYNIDNRKDIALFTKDLQNPNDFDMINYFKTQLTNYTGSMENLNIKIVNNEKLNKSIAKAFDIVLNNESHIFNNDRVKQNFIIKVMSWIKIYIEPLVINNNDAPKIIFYGDIKKHEVYLLCILYLAGFDILYLNPLGESNMNILSKETYKIEEVVKTKAEENITFEERVLLGEKVDKGSFKKTMTIGARASDRISNELLNDSGFIKPWQLQDRKVKNILLTSTMDEISIYWKQPLKLRPDFSFDKNFVNAPVFFSKIDGVYNDENEYIKFINELKNPREYVKFISLKDNFDELTKEFTNEAFSLSFMIDSNGIIDKKTIINENNYSISILNKSQQNIILEKVEEVILSNIFIDDLSREDRIRGFYSVLNMNKSLIHMINNFDYAGINPKLVIYIEKSIIFKKEIAFLLLVLSKIGFDIVILSSNGDNCIENVVSYKVIDIHRLDKMVYDFEFRQVENEKGIFKKLFGRSGLF